MVRQHELSPEVKPKKPLIADAPPVPKESLGVEKQFHVWRKVNGHWEFWFNGRGKSAADLKRRVMWKTKQSEVMEVTEPGEKPKECE